MTKNLRLWYKTLFVPVLFASLFLFSFMKRVRNNICALFPFSFCCFFSFRVWMRRKGTFCVYARCSLLPQTICPRRKSLPVPTVFEGWMGTIYVRPMCTFSWPNILFFIYIFLKKPFRTDKQINRLISNLPYLCIAFVTEFSFVGCWGV